nr:MAG TPA: hypothetical protein [Caudoviricetes sp.]
MKKIIFSSIIVNIETNNLFLEVQAVNVVSSIITNYFQG